MPSCRGLPNSAPSATPFQIFLREHAGQQRADDSADAVRGDDVERVVEPGPGAPEQREVAGNRGDPAEGDRRDRADESGRGRDRDESDDDRGRGADRGRLSSSA